MLTNAIVSNEPSDDGHKNNDGGAQRYDHPEWRGIKKISYAIHERI